MGLTFYFDFVFNKIEYIFFALGLKFFPNQPTNLCGKVIGEPKKLIRIVKGTSFQEA